MRKFLPARHFLPGWHLLSGVLLLLLSSAVPSFAQASRANPYQRLFQPRDLTDVARAQASQPSTPTQPRVVCGMSVIPMDPNIDPKIFVPRRPDGTRYAIRAIPPPICATPGEVQK